MGFADKLKSIFITEDASASKKKPAKETPKSEAAPKTTAPKSEAMVVESTTGAKGKVTSKFMNILLGAMEKHNLDGFDYIEFKESLKSLEKMPMDEGTRYQSAFAMAKTMGATPEKLIQAAGHYIKVLKHEENKFEQALVNQRKQQIGGREDQIKSMESAIRQKAEHIQKLNKEIEAHQKKLEAVKSEISGAVVKVETTQNNFIASYNTLVAQIEADVANMQKYLK